jgi:TPR repeat protein
VRWMGLKSAGWLWPHRIQSPAEALEPLILYEISGSVLFTTRYTLLAMLVVIALTLGLAQSPTGAGNPQPQSTRPQAITTTRLSPAEIPQLKARAEGGDATAQLTLGQACEDGNGIQQNDALAVKWYRKAAEQGNAEAQNSLGVMYRTGRGVESSKEEAMQWYRKAARQGNATAIFNIGTAYYNGDGVTIDDSMAYAWFLAAEAAGSKNGVDAAHRISAELSDYRRVDALMNLAGMYRIGTELPQDLAAAAKWYREAAKDGSVPARVQLANMMIFGQGVQQDYGEARHACEEAAKQRYAPGAFCVGLLYQNGLGVAKDTGETRKWFSRAAEWGHTTAMFYLGQMYWEGVGGKVDKERAYVWTFLAARAGVPGAKEREELLEKGMEGSQVKSAQKKVAEWDKQHRMLGLRKYSAPLPN